MVSFVGYRMLLFNQTKVKKNPILYSRSELNETLIGANTCFDMEESRCLQARMGQGSSADDKGCYSKGLGTRPKTIAARHSLFANDCVLCLFTFHTALQLLLDTMDR